MTVEGNLIIDAICFKLANGDDPPSCKINSGTSVYVELILRNPTIDPRKLRQIRLDITGSSKCIPGFKWIGNYGIKASTTYTISFPTFIFDATNINPSDADILGDWVISAYVVDQVLDVTLPECPSSITTPRLTEC